MLNQIKLSTIFKSKDPYWTDFNGSVNNINDYLYLFQRTAQYKCEYKKLTIEMNEKKSEATITKVKDKLV